MKFPFLVALLLNGFVHGAELDRVPSRPSLRLQSILNNTDDSSTLSIENIIKTRQLSRNNSKKSNQTVSELTTILASYPLQLQSEHEVAEKLAVFSARKFFKALVTKKLQSLALDFTTPDNWNVERSLIIPAAIDLLQMAVFLKAEKRIWSSGLVPFILMLLLHMDCLILEVMVVQLGSSSFEAILFLRILDIFLSLFMNEILRKYNWSS